MTFSSGSLPGGSIFEFNLADVQNPPSTAPTSPFANIFITDSDGFEKASYTVQEVTAQTEVGGQISSATLAQSSYENGAESDYTLTLTTVNRIPIGAAFMVTYTADVTLNSASTCQVATSGSVYRLSCYHDQYVRRITMKGSFNSEVAAGC